MPRSVRFCSAILALLFLACTTSTDRVRAPDQCHYPKIQVSLVSGDRPWLDSERDRILAAVEAWSEALPGSVTSAPIGDHILVYHTCDPRPQVAGLWREGDQSIEICPERSSDLYGVAVHELGHALGLEHYEGREPSVMHAMGPYWIDTVPRRDVVAVCR